MLKKITKWETEDGKVFDTQEDAEDYMFEQDKEVMTRPTEQPEALRLAAMYDYGDPLAHGNQWKVEVCTELRRLHARVQELEAAAPVPQGFELVQEAFLREFCDKSKTYLLNTQAPAHYWNQEERDAYSYGYQQCGSEFAKLREYLAAAPQLPGAAPEGWALVPLEATQEMIEAWGNATELPEGMVERSDDEVNAYAAQRDWKAMLDVAPAVVAVPDERSAFEAWAESVGLDHLKRGFGKQDDYTFVETRRMWEAWQGRAALAATPGSAYEGGIT